MVRAAGGGTVAESGQDPEYGWFVLLQHADGYQSMYGHLSRRLVSQALLLVRPDLTVLNGGVYGWGWYALAEAAHGTWHGADPGGVARLLSGR